MPTHSCCWSGLKALMATDKREGSFNSHGALPLLLWGLILGKVKEIMGVRCWQLFVTFFDCCFDSLSPGKTQQAVVWNAYCDMMQLFFSNKTPPAMPEEGVGGVSSAGVSAQFWCSCIIELWLFNSCNGMTSFKSDCYLNLNPVCWLRMVGTHTLFKLGKETLPTLFFWPLF